MITKLSLRLVAVVSLLCASGVVGAQLNGTRQVALVDQEDQETIIGMVHFVDANDLTSFKVDLDADVFADHFLSMRPFRCIEGPQAWSCHLPYPYDSRLLIGPDDFVDLEYALLFIDKKPTEFGINAWNGRYYKLNLLDDGTIEGVLHEVDLNILASPPEGAFARPIAEKDLTEADAQSHRFPKLRIR